VPPTPATRDAFTAIAEPRRREVLATLAHGELRVNQIVAALGWPQPQVSKHLAVLRDVGIVAVRRRGRERVYSIEGQGLKTIHDWTAMFDKFWTHNLDRIKQHAEAKARAAETKPAHQSHNSRRPPPHPTHPPRTPER
jgi:DNA-binding transcriptional ArsR family regulator